MGLRKRIPAFLLVLLLLGGCQSSASGPLAATDVHQPMQLLFLVDNSLPIEIVEAADRFADDVALYSKGILQVDVRIGASNQEVLRGRGCAISFLYNQQIANLQPAFSMLSLPFLYNDGAHMSAALNSEELMDRWWALLAPYKIKPLSAIYNGTDMLVTNQGALRAASDFNGVTIALHDGNPDKLAAFRALGANVLAYQEESLAAHLGESVQIDEKGVVNELSIDTVEVSPEQALSILERPEVLSVINTGHTLSPLWLAINSDDWDRMDDWERAVILEAGAGLTATLEENRRRLDYHLLGEMLAQGATVMDVERRRIANSLYGLDGHGGPGMNMPGYFDARLYQIIQDLD